MPHALVKASEINKEPLSKSLSTNNPLALQDLAKIFFTYLNLNLRGYDIHLVKKLL